MAAGYVPVLVMYTAVLYQGTMKASEAYEVLKGPLMALIGGSLAISKDLIPVRYGQVGSRGP